MAETARPVRVTDETFERLVARSPIPVVLDFTAAWCAPCRTFRPTLSELSEKLSGRVAFATADVDDAVGLARSFGVLAVPTFVFLEHGREKGRCVGPLDPLALRRTLRRHFADLAR